MKNLIDWFLDVPRETPKSVFWIRWMAGTVFFWEGLIKFVFANQGVGRFTKLGFPFPALTADFVGTLEIVGGLLLVFGLFTRFLTLTFAVEMVVAMLSTKISLFLGTYPLAPPPVPPQAGIWAVLHEVRSEYAQMICCLVILALGPGQWSLDWKLFGSRNPSRGEKKPH